MRYQLMMSLAVLGACAGDPEPEPFTRGEPPARPSLSERGSLVPDVGVESDADPNCVSVAEGFRFVPGEQCRYEAQTFCTLHEDCSVGARAVRHVATGECWYFSTCAPQGFVDGEAECESYSGGSYCADAGVDCASLEAEECEGVASCRLVTASAVLRSASPRCWEPAVREVCEAVNDACEEGEATRRWGSSCYRTDTCRAPGSEEHACSPEDAYPECDGWSAAASVVRLENGLVAQEWELVETPQELACTAAAEPMGEPVYLGADGVTAELPPGPQATVLLPFGAGSCAGAELEVDIVSSGVTGTFALAGEVPAELVDCGDLHLMVRLRMALEPATYQINVSGSDVCGPTLVNAQLTVQGGT